MEQSEATMETRRWFQLAAALVLGVLIGYGVARATSPDAPERRYMIGGWTSDNHKVFYRCDTFTGRTWLMFLGGASSREWQEIPQPDQVVSPRNEE